MLDTVLEVVATAQTEDRAREAQALMATHIPRVPPICGARQTLRERIASALIALAAQVSPAMTQIPRDLRAASR